MPHWQRWRSPAPSPGAAQAAVTLQPGAYHGTDATFGKVAFIGNADVTEWDFAFIELDAEDLGRVSPAVKGHPAHPKGSTVASDTLTGDVIQLSGYGLGYDTTPTTREAPGSHGVRQHGAL